MNRALLYLENFCPPQNFASRNKWQKKIIFNENFNNFVSFQTLWLDNMTHLYFSTICLAEPISEDLKKLILGSQMVWKLKINTKLLYYDSNDDTIPSVACSKWAHHFENFQIVLEFRFIFPIFSNFAIDQFSIPKIRSSNGE